MKKRTLNILYVSTLAISIVGGILYGIIVPKSSGLKEMTFDEFTSLLSDRETAKANLEHVQIYPDSDYYWIVTLKDSTERVIKTFPDEGTDEALQQAHDYGIQTHVDHGESGTNALLKNMLGLQ